MVYSIILQREGLLPSEKAQAFHMKMEAMNHKGVKGEKHSVEIIAEQTGESKTQIYRYIRLTELVVALLDKVDSEKLKFNPAVELSYLSIIEQNAVAAAMDKFEVTPSHSQAKRLKELSQSGDLTEALIDSISYRIQIKT